MIARMFLFYQLLVPWRLDTSDCVFDFLLSGMAEDLDLMGPKFKPERRSIYEAL